MIPTNERKINGKRPFRLGDIVVFSPCNIRLLIQVNGWNCSLQLDNVPDKGPGMVDVKKFTSLGELTDHLIRLYGQPNKVVHMTEVELPIL